MGPIVQPEEDPIHSAFENLSVNQKVESDGTIKKPENENSHYEADQIVCYKSNGKRCKAKIVKKHLDDELEPFYTITLQFGKEKQTDDAHLEPLDASFQNIEEKLLTFSAAQLQLVEN